uniref:Uncharacterized protein n=1 Tax=Caenorhabditis japonica TaxID=281687 RepID=A0A8R1E6C0_CAEJA
MYVLKLRGGMVKFGGGLLKFEGGMLKLRSGMLKLEGGMLKLRGGMLKLRSGMLKFELRDVLQKKFDDGATRPELVEAMVEELAKDFKREKAVKAIERTMKDLKIFGKKNPGWIEKVEKLFNHVIVHDEM